MKIPSTLRPLISKITHLSGILVPLFFAFWVARPVAAWGPVGHETVAYIDAGSLTEPARPIRGAQIVFSPQVARQLLPNRLIIQQLKGFLE